jgi:hypothetical protein
VFLDIPRMIRSPFGWWAFLWNAAPYAATTVGGMLSRLFEGITFAISLNRAAKAWHTLHYLNSNEPHDYFL